MFNVLIGSRNRFDKSNLPRGAEEYNTFLQLFFKLFVWQYDPDGYYQSNFVNDESFTRRPRYCLVFTVNAKSFTRHHRKDF